MYRIRADREAAEYAAKRISDRLGELRTRAGKVSEALATYSDGAAERRTTAAADLEAITLAASTPATSPADRVI